MNQYILYYIDLPYACFGVVTEMSKGNEYIIESAPIAKWSIGKEISTLKKFVENKNGVMIKINTFDEIENGILTKRMTSEDIKIIKQFIDDERAE